MSNLPIACELTPSELAHRSVSLSALLGAAETRDPVSNGFRWRFKPSNELLTRLIDVVNAERACCRFLRFQLTVEPDGGAVWLELSGPPGTQEFLLSVVAG
jgi:hypothetical protein